MFVFAKKWSLVFIALLVFSLGMVGCAATPKSRQPASKLDDPAHHALRGRDLIKENRWNEARREFRLALEINNTYAPALAGQALVTAQERTLAGKSDREKDKLLEKAEGLYNGAYEHAKNERELAHVHVMTIRVWTMLKTHKNWLKEAEDHFKNAVEIYEDNVPLRTFRAEPHFYLAQAYHAAAQYSKAEAQYQEVLKLNLGFTREAEAALEQIQKIMRAEPGTRLGARIARSSALTRGDMAALLVEELRLPQLYGRDGSQVKQNKFNPPNRQFVSQQRRDMPAATDIDDHPLKSDIAQVLEIGVRGLEPSPQHLFYPDKIITRAEYAIMLEDILIQVTKDRALARRFVGDTSPWPDVRSDAYYYNAARTLISRNIMSVIHQTRGEFGPGLPIHGSDALLGIRTLKSELENYIRKPES